VLTIDSLINQTKEKIYTSRSETVTIIQQSHPRLDSWCRKRRAITGSTTISTIWPKAALSILVATSQRVISQQWTPPWRIRAHLAAKLA